MQNEQDLKMKKFFHFLLPEGELDANNRTIKNRPPLFLIVINRYFCRGKERDDKGMPDSKDVVFTERERFMRPAIRTCTSR
jgi:hypothetical protein